MTEHTLLYIIAVATVVNALAWIALVIFGMHLNKEMQKFKREMAGEIRAIIAEVVPLLREVRGTVGEVRRVTESGRRISEEVATAVLLRKISPKWFSKGSAVKVGIHAAREGLGMLRKWLHKKADAAGDDPEIELPTDA